MKKWFRRILYVLIGLALLVGCLMAVSAWSNRHLPARSKVVDRFSALDKARLAEAIHLRRTLGDTVWPGWAQMNIPIIVYNEEYVFLVGYLDPPAGWLKMPQKEPRGGAWEVVPNDAFDGQVYYRQRLMSQATTPENFTVLVGERWVATLQTRDYSEIAFYPTVGGQDFELSAVTRLGG